MSLLERLSDLKTCTYCAKRFKKGTMKPLKNDDNPSLNRLYCEHCHPIVQKADYTLPWKK